MFSKASDKFVTVAEWGIIIRQKAIERAKLTRKQLLEIFETEKPLSENAQLISFGPHFGGEAADNLMRRLEKAGLTYVDDFFIFEGQYPDWIQFVVRLSSES